MFARAVCFLACTLALVACEGDPEVTGPFVPDADDEVVELADPPTDPDPADATESVDVTVCPQRETLSPKGLTLVIHVSKNADHADRELNHLKALRRYIRARDVFMVERRSPVIAALHDLFPCNRFHYIAYPDEMKDALSTGDRIDGIAVDWEGSTVEANSQTYSANRLHDYVHDIRAAGKQPGFVPAWSSRFDDAAVTRASNMDYELAQIQGACVNTPAAFGHAAHALLVAFHERSLPLRNLGFEISLDSYAFADNHVGAGRAADCTRSAYGKGARAIYLYGNGGDQLPDYFHTLGRMGVREPR